MRFRILLTAISLAIFTLTACTSKEEKEKKVAEDKKVRKPEDDKADSLLLVYDKKKEALQDSLDERLKIQEEYYKKQDELQNDGAAGFISSVLVSSTFAFFSAIKTHPPLFQIRLEVLLLIVLYPHTYTDRVVQGIFAI